MYDHYEANLIVHAVCILAFIRHTTKHQLILDCIVSSAMSRGGPAAMDPGKVSHKGASQLIWAVLAWMVSVCVISDVGNPEALTSADVKVTERWSGGWADITLYCTYCKGRHHPEAKTMTKVTHTHTHTQARALTQWDSRENSAFN